MGDNVKDITETAENKAAADAIDRVRLARQRREAEHRRRLDELRAHAAATQVQREKRDEELRRRQLEQRANNDGKRSQVEERKQAIWEASKARREALLERERERTERLERARAARSSPRPTTFAFGSSTPRLLEPIDSTGFFRAARSTNPIETMNFFEAMAASTTNVMFASAPLRRGASALQLNSEIDMKDEPDRHPQAVMWSSVARRRTDLVPTLPAPRAPGRAYSMTRLDKIPSQRPLHSTSPSMHHLNRTQTRSGETTPGSRPGSAMSNATAGVVRRANSVPKKPRPASIAGTGVNTPRGASDMLSPSVPTTPPMSRGSTMAANGPCGPYPRRPYKPSRPASIFIPPVVVTTATPPKPADRKPPVHRKPKPSKDHDKTPRGKSVSVSPGRTQSPGRTLSPSPAASKEPSVDKEVAKPSVTSVTDKNQVNAIEVTQKLEALQIQNGEEHYQQNVDNTVCTTEVEYPPQQTEAPKAADQEKPAEGKPVEPKKPVEKKEPSVEKKETLLLEKPEENEMTASQTARRITTEEQAKAALAERRRRAREELERQAELERQRLQREAEEEAERQRQEEERQRHEEEEARELAQLQRRMEEEKLRKAIEAQQQLEREEVERKAREELERQARLKEDEEKRRSAEEAERLRKEEAEREEKERLARKQRVEAIMARTRFKKQAEEQTQQETKSAPNETQQASAPTAAPAPAPAPAPASAQPDNGNSLTGDLLGLNNSQPEESKAPQELNLVRQANNVEPAPAGEPNSTPNNGNVTDELLVLFDQIKNEETQEQTTAVTNKVIDNSPNANAPSTEANNGNVQQPANAGHISANFIQTERRQITAEHSQSKLPENAPKLIEDDFTSHNGHGAAHNHPLTLQNAI